MKDIKYVPKEVVESIKSYTINKEDLFISVAGTLGIVGKIPEQLDGANLTENANKICNISIDNNFLLWTLRSERIQGVINSQKTIGAQPKLALTRIKEFDFAVPPLAEQQKIADILSTVDEQIDNVDRLIEKTKELKKGLMQQLLTKGIGHTEFKETEVGVIPKEWEVKKLEEATNLITDGSHFSPVPVESSNFKICTVMNMNKRWLDIDNATSISEEDFKALCKNNCNPITGDVLLSKDGTVGKVIMYNSTCTNVVLLSSIAIIRGKGDNILGKYLAQYLSDESVLTRLLNMKTGSAIKRIVLRDIKNLKIPIPSIKEQEEISTILENIDEKVDILENKKEKLQQLKKGLMQQLLTGKIRVKTDEVKSY